MNPTNIFNQHKNAPMSLIYTVTGAQTEEGEALDVVEYDFTPKGTMIKKPGDRYELSMSWSLAPETDADALKNCRLVDTRNFALDCTGLKLTKDGSETVISFSADLDDNSTYRFIVAEGIFGNITWLSSDKTRGSANPQIVTAFIPNDITTGAGTADADTPATPVTVYTVTGIRLHTDASDAALRALPAGLYIIAGKKVMVK